ncbi:methyltransferase domain-containing protein [Bryobacter aggregatus]|uniref:methyltransferase domain-containing protein n=1 Tax=Bryobacter aggregatus TaxID=360054 RepID=UPI0004E24C21|nr:methyltransferase domain-containing protein [Bryobacter aggregatus]
MSLAQSEEFRAKVRDWVASIDQQTNYHSLELPDGVIVPGVIPIDALQQRLRDLEVPGQLQGLRVLDIGAASGWNSFELEKRGAEVVAIDCVEYREFSSMIAVLDSSVDYRIVDVDEMSSQILGTFDVVLFLGVLYHLRHPLLALEQLCSLTRDIAYVESYVTDSSDSRSDQVSMEFYEIDELGGQIDNWFGPTTNCLLALCRAAGFASVTLQYSRGGRAGLICRRKWEAPPICPQEQPPVLVAAVNNRSHNNEFHLGLDEYICIYFDCEKFVDRHGLLIEVGGFGIAPMIVACNAQGEWQANSRLPPGLPVGEHAVKIRFPGSAYSNSYVIELKERVERRRPQRFEVAREITESPVELYRVVNSKDGSQLFHGHRAERLSASFRSTEKGLGPATVSMECGGQAMSIDLLIELGGGAWQVNAKLPPSLESGSHPVRLRTAKSNFSAATSVRLER